MEPQIASEKKKSSKFKSFILTVFLILTIILLIGAGGSAYWWRNDQANKQQSQNQETINQLQKEIDALKKQLASQTSTTTTTKIVTSNSTPVQPSQAAVDNIKAAFTSKNTAVLEGYMAPIVTVVYAASEMGGDKTPAQAVAAMDYVNSGAVGPWNFNLDKAVLANYANGDYSQYFVATTLVGRSSNGYVVAVNFDSNGKINGIFVSASDTLL